jgi:AraC-like DNA-binding protein
MSVRCIWPFRSVTKELGLDFDAAWSGLGIGAEQLADPDTRIPVSAAQRRARFVVETTGAWDYGLRAALAADAGLFDLPEYAARCQSTLAGSVDCLVRFVPLMLDVGGFVQHAEGGAVTLKWVQHPRAPLDRSSVDFLFAYTVLAARRFTGKSDLEPPRVQFRREAPPDAGRYAAVFGRFVEFDAPADTLTFSREQLALPLKHADSLLSVPLDRVANHLLAQRSNPEARFSEQVRRLVTRHIAIDGAPVTAVAGELGITPRTLHRRLAEEGTTYRDIADEIRRGLALGYMEQRDLAVSEIAYLLGFSGVQAFHRAFKRWTGKTPGAFRQK